MDEINPQSPPRRLVGAVHSFIATCGGIGCLPMAPGTWGSAFGWAMFWLLRDRPLATQGAVALGVFVLALRSIPDAERQLRHADDPRIVIDECVGVMLALCGVPWRWRMWLAGLVLFRALDILKPWGLRRLERWRSPWGVVMDDVAAGLIANGALQLWLRLAWWRQV